MNERILELADKAFSEYESDAVKYEARIPDEFCLKFAELIVLECIKIVKPSQHHEAFAQSYLGGIGGLDLLDGKVKQIKQHFGVEE